MLDHHFGVTTNSGGPGFTNHILPNNSNPDFQNHEGKIISSNNERIHNKGSKSAKYPFIKFLPKLGKSSHMSREMKLLRQCKFDMNMNFPQIYGIIYSLGIP